MRKGAFETSQRVCYDKNDKALLNIKQNSDCRTALFSGGPFHAGFEVKKQISGFPGEVHMKRNSIRHTVKMLIFLAVFLAWGTVGTGRLGLTTAYAMFIGGSINTSMLTDGTNYDLSSNTVLTIDKTVDIGWLYTGSFSLTIKGDTGVQLKLDGISSKSGGTAGDIVINSGSVVVDSINGPDAKPDGIYTTGSFKITGGSMEVYVSRQASAVPVHGIRADRFQMDGGELRVDVRTFNERTATGIDVFGQGSISEISAGILDITSLTDGIRISQNTALQITGGTVSTEGGLGMGSGSGIAGTTATKVTISGGKVFAKGGSNGISCAETVIQGSAAVDARGDGIAGIETDALTVSGAAQLKADGKKYALLAKKSKGGILLGPKHYIASPPAGVISTPAGRGESNDNVYVAVSNTSLKTPATFAIIRSTESGTETETGEEDKKKEEETILAPVDSRDAASLRDPSGSGELSANTVNALPENSRIGKVDAAGIILKGNVARKRLTVKFGKVDGATNYIISWKRAVAKNWTYAACGNTGSFLMKGVRRGTLLDIRIAAYAHGSRGPWSDISRCYYEKSKASAVRRGKTLTVTFANTKGASGYELHWADNRQMKDCRTRSVRNRSRKIVLRNLKKSKKYFIRWRPFRLFRGKKYLGLCSNVKKV